MSAIPLRTLDAARFARLRTLMDEWGFDEAGLCDRLGMATVFDFAPGRHRRSGEASLETALDVLVRLFMDGDPVAPESVGGLLGAEGRDLLDAAGLLGPSAEAPGKLAGTVLMYPVGGLRVVSDRYDPVSGESGPDDTVYPALTGSARTFLATLPTPPVDAYLELCSGTGIAALIGSAAGVGHAWAVDITARATEFARFNAALNGLEQVTALEGDLWAPVGGRTFDVVVAHPPYIPSNEPKLIYRDGGEDGERITRAMIEGLPPHVAEGGVFYCTGLLSSRKDRPAPARIREMLGSRADEFDLVLLRNRSITPTELFATRLTDPDPEKAAVAAGQFRRLEALGVESLHLATTVLRRHGSPRPGFTLTLDRGRDVRWEHLAWALDLGAAAADPDRFAEDVLGAAIRLAPSVEFDVTYRARREGGGWSPAAGRIRATVPFASTVETSLADAETLGRFDGSRTLAEELDRLRAEGRIPPAVEAAAFVRSLLPLIFAGILVTGALPLPEAGV